MKLGIDVPTEGKNETIRRLRRLKTTIEVSDGGVYWEDRNYSQIHLETTWTEAQLDDWLYRMKGIEYVGTFEMKESNREGENDAKAD